MKRPSNNTSPSNLKPPTSPRDLTPPTSPRHVQQTNTQTTQSITEQPSTTPPQLFQRTPVDRNILFPSGSTNNPNLQPLDPFFNHGFIPLLPMYDPNKSQSGLTDHLYTQLVDPLSRQDFETAMRIAGVNSIEKFYDLVDYRKKTLLMFAAKLGHTEVIKALLSKSSNPDSFICMKDELGLTALMHASTFGHIESIKVLLSSVSDRDAMVCMKDANGMNSLMLAISNGHYESVKVLLEGVRNPEQLIFMQNNNNETALMPINDFNRYSGSRIFSSLLPKDGITGETGDSFQANLIKTLLSFVNDRDAFVCMKDSNGLTALMHAIKGRNPESVKVLLANVKNPEQLIYMKDSNGWTALMHAADLHDYETIKILLDRVSNQEQLILMKSNDNKTILMLALGYGYSGTYRYTYDKDFNETSESTEQKFIYQIASIKALLSGVTDKEALICKQDADGKTLLMHLRMDNVELIKFLLNSVNNPDELLTMKDSKGKNVLMYAASSGNAKSIEVILSVVKNPEAFATMRDSEGMTALMYAICEDQTDSTKAILSNVKNADELAFMKDKDDYNALMLAAIYCQEFTITVVLDYVKNPIDYIYYSMDDGTTALMLGAKAEYYDLFDDDISNKMTAILEKVKKVRDLDSLIFMKDSQGMNAFMFALEENNITPALTLLDSTTDILRLFTEKNNDQRTAIDLFYTENIDSLCDALIERVEHLQLSDHSEDLVTVMRLLQQRRNRFH